MLKDNVEKPSAELLLQQAPPMSHPAKSSPSSAVGASTAKARIVFESRDALPPIKLAQVTHLFQVHWLFRVGVYEHQEAYDSEREAIQSAERLLFTLFSDIADDQQQAALRRGDIALAFRFAERRGYWQGRKDEKHLHQAAVGGAFAALRHLT
ncbi:hypothetical protein HWE02_08450 [Pseudomonas oryzihabitans]|uniref:hypothetical protein n=1 Tax=Pseudomonas oryzihabitans TaxID=47885 RepID=UPI001F5209E6|nr:hypothetical protein [Pseudomonas oryzihabitans]MCI1009290.1 hypothetical protein [Pseudomonas oryzihabitans]